MSKLEQLSDIEGLGVDDMLEEAVMDSVTPGICTNDECDYTTHTEPDSDGGYCEVCGTHSVTSCLMLAGVI